MNCVIGILNKTRLTSRFLSLRDGYPCDVESLYEATPFRSEKEAQEIIEHIMSSSTIEMSCGTRLDPTISNIANLDGDNEIALIIYRLSIEPIGQAHYRVSEQPPSVEKVQ